jgi:peptidoglycan hydrolase-like protein with peptidoglycan-binding domain
MADRSQQSVVEAAPEQATLAPAAAPMAPAAQAILRLQRTAGNRATVAMLQRREVAVGLSGLRSKRFAGDETLQKAFDEDPPLRRPARGEAVKKVQQALADEGYDMPRSFDRKGKPDGIYGKETVQVVLDFQRRYGLDETGEVGRQVLGKLDQFAAGRVPGPGEKVRGPEIEATDEAMGAYVVEAMKRTDDVGPTWGVHYHYNYFARHQKDPDQYPWDDDWRTGHADEDFFEKLGWMAWRLKPGRSASAAVRKWLKGMTIAECRTTILVIQMDALRAPIGDDAFDARFGSPDESLPETTRLLIHVKSAETPLERRLFNQNADKSWNPGPYGARNVKVGDRIYFYNHPRYLLKHPGGAWQGENAVYEGFNEAGQQTFSGLGATGKSEDAMLEEMAGAYNQDRSGDDYATLCNWYAPDAPEVVNPSREFLDHDLATTQAVYEKYKSRVPKEFREESGQYPEHIEPADILSAKPYTLHGTTRKGGFDRVGTQRLDKSRVSRLRPEP